jgi:hypothetical protein
MHLASRFRSLVLGVAFAALLTVGDTAVALPSGADSSISAPQVTAGSTTALTASRAETRANARFYVAGYLWSDGGGASPNFGYRTSNLQIADRFQLAAETAGAHVTRGQSGKFHTFRVQGLTLDLPLDQVPPLLRGASDAQTKAFAAAVIEGEGSRSGLVIDDPELGHVVTMQRLVRRVGIRTHVEGVNFVRLFAERADWPKFGTFPFVVRTRVPGA